MTPPLPPRPRAEQAGPPPPMPHYLQIMMREMQQKQPKWQQNQQMEPPVPDQRGSGRYGGRERGRYGGRGRGGSQRQKNRKNHRDDQVQYNRKRGPSEDVRDASRFFLPSFLGDPWNELEAEQQAAQETKKNRALQSRTDMYQTRHCAVHDGRGRVLFRPSFLEDPWLRVYN